MANIPEKVCQAFSDLKGAAVFTTVDQAGVPNSIYVTCVSRYDDSTIVVADNYFDKTRKNIKSGSKGSILFMSNGGASYQMKGTINYHTEGAIFDDMKKWNPAKHPGHAAAALTVEEVYDGATKL